MGTDLYQELATFHLEWHMGMLDGAEVKRRLAALNFSAPGSAAHLEGEERRLLEEVVNPLWQAELEVSDMFEPMLCFEQLHVAERMVISLWVSKASVCEERTEHPLNVLAVARARNDIRLLEELYFTDIPERAHLLFQCLTYQPTSSSDCETDRPKVLSRREIEQIPGRYYNPVAGTWNKAAIYALIQFYFPEHPILRPQPSRRFAWETTPPADSVSV